MAESPDQKIGDIMLVYCQEDHQMAVKFCDILRKFITLKDGRHPDIKMWQATTTSETCPMQSGLNDGTCSTMGRSDTGTFTNQGGFNSRTFHTQGEINSGTCHTPPNPGGVCPTQIKPSAATCPTQTILSSAKCSLRATPGSATCSPNEIPMSAMCHVQLSPRPTVCACAIQDSILCACVTQTNASCTLHKPTQFSGKYYNRSCAACSSGSMPTTSGCLTSAFLESDRVDSDLSFDKGGKSAAKLSGLNAGPVSGDVGPALGQHFVNRLRHFQTELASSHFVFLFVNTRFMTDSWAQLQSEECVLQGMYDVTKRDSLVPIYPPSASRSKSSRGLQEAPIGWRTVKGIDLQRFLKGRLLNNVRSASDISQSDVDKYSLQNITHLLNSKIKGRKSM